VNIAAFDEKDAKLLTELLRFFMQPKQPLLSLSLPKGCEDEAPSGWELKECEASGEPRVVVNQSEEQLAQLNQFYFCSSFRCLKITGKIPQLSPALFGDLEPCCLSSEASDFPQFKRHYPTLKAWLNDMPKDTLLVTSQELVPEVLLINEPDDLWLLAFDDDNLILDLRLEDSSQAHYRAYSQLSAWYLCLEYYDEIDRLSLSRCYQNSAGSYGFFAEFYDRYMAHVDYSEWIEMILTWARHFMRDTPKVVLEMACGTANISEQLVYKGMKVDGFDSSPFMLHEASKKSFKPNLYLASLTQAPRRGNHYDLILCLFDSINYLLKKEEIKKTINNAHLALKPGGLFVFDISTIYNSRNNFCDEINNHQFEDATIVQHAYYDEVRLRQRSFLTLYRRKGTAYVMSQEDHCQRVYYHREIMSMLKDCPLELKGIFATEVRGNLISRKMQDLDFRYPRLFYMLQKSSS
jgi:SAM-dependent methyltransferase